MFKVSFFSSLKVFIIQPSLSVSRSHLFESRYSTFLRVELELFVIFKLTFIKSPACRFPQLLSLYFFSIVIFFPVAY
ncbi:TPA: hypothetical protein DEG21_00310 [Patescibacteria group bacterium]|nr:hypothetical protein [Candidatus Gracilibacteria bacterium]HBY74369.1 hypothetical protein [Candidatus Gracilibacteria bacterium]